MHRKFVISGDLEVLRALATQLCGMDDIVRVSLSEGGTLKPPGGATLDVQALNRSADEVLRRLAAPIREKRIVVEVSESTAIMDAARQRLIDHDYDEMLWEEMEQNLRNQARISTNALVLMGLGGAIATAGFLAPRTVQTVAVVAASIIAPGFDGVAGVSLGVVLRQWRVALFALLSTSVSYAVAIAASALTFAALHPAAARADFFADPGVVETLFHGPPVLIVSAACATAGALMIVSLRDIYVVGPLIGLMMIPASALVGCGIASGRWDEALSALRRMGVDLGFVVAASAVVFWVKQRTVHHRRPLE